MPKRNALVQAFNRGLISRLALARVEVERVAMSAELMTNWKGKTLGSMSLRPGLEFILDAGSAQPRHLDFVKAIDDTALIELTNNQIRVLVDDELLQSESVASLVTNGDFSAGIANWTDSSDAGASASSGTAPSSDVSIEDAAIVDGGAYDDPGGVPYVYYKLGSDGVAALKGRPTEGDVYQPLPNQWLLSGAAASYEVFVEKLTEPYASGTLQGTFNTWLNLGTTREWGIVPTGPGQSFLTANLGVKIREVGTTTILDEAEIGLLVSTS